MEPPRPHERLVTAAEVCALVGGARPGLLVVTGQYAPDPAHQARVLVLDCGRRPEVAWDGWMAPAEVAALALALGARRGECDAMYATPWMFAWAEAGGQVWLYSTDGLCAVAGPAGLRRVPDGVSSARASEVEAAAPTVATGVRVTLSDDWIARGVQVSTGAGAVTVASTTDPMVALDPTYDGLNLLCDASWAVALAQALARALGVPVGLPPALS